MPNDSNDNEGFVSRWSRRKQQVAQEEQHLSPTEELIAEVEEVVDPEQLKAEKLEALNKLTDEDMPDVESLNEDSDFSSFMSTGVSESLRRMALKKLFMGKSFNIRDGLDEYDDDYTKFEKMPSNMITSDMKHMIEVEARKKREKEEEEERQRMIAAGEIDEDAELSETSVEEIDEFDEFADEEQEEYVDEHINVEGFDTSDYATDDSNDDAILVASENAESNEIEINNTNNDNEEVA